MCVPQESNPKTLSLELSLTRLVRLSSGRFLIVYKDTKNFLSTKNISNYFTSDSKI
jgi:hypothetical protein